MLGCLGQVLTKAFSILKILAFIYNVTYFGNSLSWLSERKFVPVDLLGLFTVQVYDSLIAGGTVDGANVLLGEHGIFFFLLARLQLGHHFIKSLELNKN
jgi:hypothetical protein